MEIGPETPVLPALTSGKADGSPRMKSGFEVTVRVKEVVKVADVPAVVA
jgi:hypothetical protein